MRQDLPEIEMLLDALTDPRLIIVDPIDAYIGVGEVDSHRNSDLRSILAPLADPTFFAQVTTTPESGTVTWPNGADLDPDVLYAAITGVPVEQRLAPAEAS